ncbi:MAG: molybdopterin molybdotransferase MoeA [Bacteroidetes bacterium]|nr:molybdopterin molybdotransferase MoeA [Bacteroidota bacterium]
MTTVEQAEKLIQAEARSFGAEAISFEKAVGRVLAEDVKADRNLPPFNRVTMDGIAISYAAIEQNIPAFRIIGTQAAGDQPIELENPGECIEIMTGAALPASADTVVPYEQLKISGDTATLTATDIKRGQNLHLRGADKKSGDIIIRSGKLITPAMINTIASVGKSSVLVKKLPRVAIISSGDELVDIEVEPSPVQIRKSNSYTIQAVLSQHNLSADLLHIPEDAAVTREKIAYSIKNYDVILMTGGISAGKFDYIPRALDDSGVKTIFHKVSQRPGKPFWFGKHEHGALVFAFPGNPVATFMCLHRYFLPWLNTSLGLAGQAPVYAALSQDFMFKPELTYFLQVKLRFTREGQLLATPVEGNGSGDFANLADTDAFMELPLGRSEFKSGDVFRTWPFSKFVI